MGEWAMEGMGAPSLVPGVRRWVRDVLAEMPYEVRDRTEVIASEFTTNCIRHSRAADGGPVSLRLTHDGERIRLEVRDQGARRSGTDVWAPDEAADFGRGLFIVEQLADDMGDEITPTGRLAWAEIKL